LKKIVSSVFAALLLGIVASDHAASGAGMGGTLFCSCTDRTYDTPKDLLPNCTRGSLARPLCGAILPVDKKIQNCPVFKEQNGFTLAYNAVVLGRQVTAPVIKLGIRGRSLDDYAAVVGLIINTYFRSWARSDVYIEVTPGAAEGGEYARVKQIRAATIALIARGAVFQELSPAALIAKIGHEMIHVEQLKRRYSGILFDRINDMVAAMNELEASSWETASTGFAWKIGPTNELWGCETDKERDFAVAVRKCRDWQSKELLLAVNQNRSAQDNFAAWLNQNPWARTQWLPGNRDWKNVRTNTPAPVIPIPSDPGRGFNCADLMPER
jgi:hypothetical protein